MTGKEKNVAIAAVCVALIVLIVATSELSVSQVAATGVVVLIPIALGGLAGVFGLVPFVKSAEERARDRENKKNNDQ